MKKLLFVLAAAASIAMVSCSTEGTEVDGRDGTRGSTELPEPDANGPDVDTTVEEDSSAVDVGIDSTDVIPEPEVVAVETTK